jgi:ATP-binding cassette subfamily C protein
MTHPLRHAVQGDAVPDAATAHHATRAAERIDETTIDHDNAAKLHAADFFQRLHEKLTAIFMTGRARHATQSDDQPRAVRNETGQARSAGLLRHLRKELASAFLAAGIVTLFVNIGLLFVPIYDMILMDRVLRSKNFDTVTMLTIGVAIAMVIYGALEFCRSSIFIVMADRLARRLNIETLQAAMAKSLQGSSSAAAQAMRDLNELRLFIAGPAAIVPLDLIWSPALLLVLFLLHPAYGLFGLLCAGFLFLLSLLTDLSTREDLVRANGATAKSLNDLSAALRNTELLDGMGMLPDVARRWSYRQQRTLDDVKRASSRKRAFATAAKAARLAMQAGVMALGAVLVMRYEASPGSMMGANVILAKLLLPFEQLVGGWRQWASMFAAWGRINDLLRGAREKGRDVRPEQIEGRLTFDSVSFTPPRMIKPVLEDISFTIEPGEAVGIVGPSGSGKSTLARLVVRIFEPTAGEISIDGIPTQRWDRAALGRHVGYLPQSISLLDGTILDNIARMQEEEPLRVIEAARAAGIHDLVGRLPEGYSTWIGGSGYALSGGQQQRVALARALFGHPKLLVLDEPNSNLDHLGEQSLVQTIEGAKRNGASVLLITHRPNVLAAVDKIIVIKQGRIEQIVRAEEYFASPETRLAPPRGNAEPQGRLVSA